MLLLLLYRWSRGPIIRCHIRAVSVQRLTAASSTTRAACQHAATHRAACAAVCTPARTLSAASALAASITSTCEVARVQ